jgi:hypothetical protein
MWLLLLGCAREAPHTPHLGRADGELSGTADTWAAGVAPHGAAATEAFDRHVVSAHAFDSPGPERSSLGEEATVLSDLGAHLEDAEAGGGGETLQAVFDEMPARRADEYGLAALSLLQLFGDAFHRPVCEDSQILAPVRQGGEDWVLDLDVPTFLDFTTDPAPETPTTITNACRSALSEATGDPDAAIAAGCSESEMHEFFPEGSTCRACLGANGGDLGACEDAGECAEDATPQVWFDEGGAEVWYEVNWAYMWGCAPDRTVLTLLMTEPREGDTLPDAFDHPGWGYLCIPYWDEDAGQPTWTCVSGMGVGAGGDTLTEGLWGRVNGIYRDGEPSDDYLNLPYYAESITDRNGGTLRWSWGFASSAGAVSMDTADGGFGVNPYELRPDGTDPTVLDDTRARDWIATIALKTSTTRGHVPIDTFNHNHCLEWEAPGPDGSSRCLQQGEPTEGWDDDTFAGTADPEDTIAQPFPVVTIASPGTFDPDIPGGVVPEIWGSPTLGDPEWDNCAWPRTFIPDRAPIEDQTGVYGGPASLWGDTWRFDAHPDEDFRAVFAVNQARDYCPGNPL